MARIRSIKPEFFTSVVVARVSIHAAFMFSGIWTQCDDHGRMIEDARLIKAALFPLRDEVTPYAIEEYLEELAHEGLVIRYKVDGRNYLAIPQGSWIEHQKIDRKKESKLPQPPEIVATRRRRNSDATATRARSIAVGKEGKGSGKGDGREMERTRRDESLRDASRQLPGQSTDRSAYAEQERELRAAAMPHELLAFDALIHNHPNPDGLVLELHATASGMHVVRGTITGKVADIADVMRAVAEMAAVGKTFSVPLFRGFLRRIADRPPEPATTEERQIAKLEAEIAKRAGLEPTQGERNEAGVIVPVVISTDDTPEAQERRRVAREEAMAKFRAEAGRYRAADPAAA